MGVKGCHTPFLAGKNNLMSLFQLRCCLQDSGLFRGGSPLLSCLVVYIKTGASTDTNRLFPPVSITKPTTKSLA